MNKYVTVTKVGVVEDPVYPTIKKENWVFGEKNLGSPFEGYWLTGYLIRPLEVNGAIKVAWDTRNGVKSSGIFQSSRVQKIEGNLYYTENSIYKVE